MDNNHLPHFDSLYVISDLHLGGPQHFQIFDSGEKLKLLIEHVQQLAASRKVGLVINGDVVDFLAENNAVYFDLDDAVNKLTRIMGDPSFFMIWEALRNFASSPNTSLVLILGNHDVELALPWVRSELLKKLSGDDPSVAGKITLAFNGEGFSCMVGKAKVLCVHGNEVDAWNVTDHETIRRMGRDTIQGREVERWIPNAGTQLVIDIMNSLKRKYAFIDLLKPEIAAVIPIILALDPSQKNKVLGLVNVLTRKLSDKFRMATGFLGNAADGIMETPLTVQQFSEFVASPTKIDRGRFQKANQAYAERMLEETETRFLDNLDPFSLIDPGYRGQTLGLFSALTKFLQGADKNEVLREALEKLQKDRSFDVTAEDETFTLLDELIGDNIDIIIAGHTHLEKAIPRKHGNGFYFNSGTWVRLIKLEPGVLQNQDQFKQIIKAFKLGNMEALDAFHDPEPLVRRRLTVVEIQHQDHKTIGTLKHVGSTTSPDLFSSDGEISYTCPNT